MDDGSQGEQVPEGRAPWKERATRRWILVPHRSLGRTGFLAIMAGLVAVSFVAGTVFALMGAWPVAGFFGLDVLLVWAAFRINYRAARRHEIVELAPDALTVTHITPGGRRSSVRFNPYWVRVRLAERADGRTRLGLVLHGRETVFGTFLNDDDRRGFAAELGAALAEARTGPGR